MNKSLVPYYKAQMEKRTGLKLDYVNEDEEYIEGQKYFCGYLQEVFEVLKYEKNPINDWASFRVTTKWQDGRITIHCTSLRDDDFKIIEQ